MGLKVFPSELQDRGQVLEPDPFKLAERIQ